jgi:hypothetical protein
MTEIEQKIKEALLIRGFKNETILNNRGLIGAVIDETILETVKNTVDLADIMPRELTAENGAKQLLSGEFYECFDPEDSGNPYIVPISWNAIKKIYKRIRDHYVA